MFFFTKGLQGFESRNSHIYHLFIGYVMIEIVRYLKCHTYIFILIYLYTLNCEYIIGVTI